MRFDATINALNSVLNQVVHSIKEDIILYKPHNKVASGSLLDSITIALEVDSNGIKAVGRANEYWYFVDKGRAAGSFPPVDAIRQWIQDKGIQSDISENSLAYLIGRKIAAQGIEPTNIFTKNTDKISDSDKLNEAIKQDIEKEIYGNVNNNK